MRIEGILKCSGVSHTLSHGDQLPLSVSDLFQVNIQSGIMLVSWYDAPLPLQKRILNWTQNDNIALFNQTVTWLIDIQLAYPNYYHNPICYHANCFLRTGEDISMWLEAYLGNIKGLLG